MRFNEQVLIEFATTTADHEGRLSCKVPRTLKEFVVKERWFKLKGNMLFYYRLNQHGAVEKNEPNGVYVLENCDVISDESCQGTHPYCFAIIWKDEPDKKLIFYSHNETNTLVWFSKICSASYDHLRSQLNTLRQTIKQKSGNDPLEHLGPLPPLKPSRPPPPLPSRFKPQQIQTRIDYPSYSFLSNGNSTSCNTPTRSAPPSPAPLPPPRAKSRKNYASTECLNKDTCNKFDNRAKQSSFRCYDKQSHEKYNTNDQSNTTSFSKSKPSFVSYNDNNVDSNHKISFKSYIDSQEIKMESNNLTSNKDNLNAKKSSNEPNIANNLIDFS